MVRTVLMILRLFFHARNVKPMKVSQRISSHSICYKCSRRSVLVQIGHDQNTLQQVVFGSLHHLVTFSFLHCIAMNPSILKRKRFYFIEEDEHDSSAEELLKLASNFAASADADTSKWMKSAATKVLANSATKDMILLYPSSKGDDGEIANDEWALTSNSVFYTLQPVPDDFVSQTVKCC